jgi:tetratricopeptide (TPR) repeat protein
MFQLKKLSAEGIDAALAKADRYRLLNEPWQAESLCRDILEADPENENAVITLILALTDQFGEEGGARVEETKALLGRLGDEYSRHYYAGLIAERRGMAHLKRHASGSGYMAHGALVEAMAHYERAEPLRPAGNDSAILRWNTCARAIMQHAEVRPEPAVEIALELE